MGLDEKPKEKVSGTLHTKNMLLLTTRIMKILQKQLIVAALVVNGSSSMHHVDIQAEAATKKPWSDGGAVSYSHTKLNSNTEEWMGELFSQFVMMRELAAGGFDELNSLIEGKFLQFLFIF